MSIFDSFFGINRDYPKVGEAVAEAQKKAEEDKKAFPCYQVGFTADNRVTLRLGSDYGSTLTMTTEGVRHLIRQLEAAIPEYYVPDSVKEDEDKEE